MHIFGDDYPTPDGTCVRDYIHVTDLADAHLRALAACRPGQHRVYNLGNGAGFSVREVIEVCREVTGADIGTDVDPRRPGDPAVLVASSEKIQSELGWRAEKDLRAMAADAWQFTQARSMPGEGGRALRVAVRRGAGRRVAGPGAGQPDGRAHRLQRRVRAPVRAQPGRHGRGGAAGRAAADVVLPPGARGHGRDRARRAGARPGDRLGRLPGRRRLGARGGRPPGARRLPRHRLRPARRRRPVLLGCAGVRDRAGPNRAGPDRAGTGRAGTRPNRPG